MNDMLQELRNKYSTIIGLIIYRDSLLWIKKILLSLLGGYRFYKLVSHADKLPLMSSYERRNNREKDFFRGVVLMFDGKAHQPGLADCLRGMTTVYHICKTQNIPFKLYYRYPFTLEKYLEPNNYEWRIDEKQITHDMSLATPFVSISYNNTFGSLNSDFQKKYITEKISSCKGKQIHLYTNAYCYDDYFNSEFVELFRPSKMIQELVEEQKSILGESYISASFRFASLLGDLQDTYGTPLEKNDADELIDTCIRGLKELHTNHPSCHKILVTTDSVTFMNEAKNKLEFVYFIPGEIGHLAYNGGEGVVVKTLLDMFLIAGAECAYMLRTNIMYQSGFAKRAAMIGKKTFKEIIL